MLYRVKLTGKAQKQLDKINKKDQESIISQFVLLTENPFLGKKLKGELEGYYSIRVWPYRILYRIIKQELLILVFRIGHRKGVYK